MPFGSRSNVCTSALLEQFASDRFAGTAFEEDVVGNNDRGAAVLLQDGEDVLEEVELKCQCGSHLLVLAQKSSR